MYPMYPMKMNPVYKNYLWGGTSLNKDFNKNSKFSKTAESWELSCCKDGLSVINNGYFENKILLDIIKKYPSLVCNNWNSKSEFPLLIKLIDANDRLSIQVHPSDELADKTKGQQGKAEMWYILDCKKDAFLYMGFKENMTEELIRKNILSGSICNYLNKVFVKPGDVFYIRPGTVHAIGAGILIAEIQQNSNTTFRLFDYDRVDSNGKKRDLHLDEAIRVCDKNKYLINNNNLKESKIETVENFKKLVDCEYFKVVEYTSNQNLKLNSKTSSFQALLFIDGNGQIVFEKQEYVFKKGDCYFIPAGLGSYEIVGGCKVLVSEV